MTNYLGNYSTKRTPQSEPIPGREAQMKKNHAGGYTFTLGDWARLQRFLTLGTEGGTYYVGERKLTIENAACVMRCIAADGPRTVQTIVDVSDSGRAPKNDPAIFALALCAASNDRAVRRLAFEALPKVCRIGTHLFHFAQYANNLRGWGRGLRTAIGNWYLKQDPADLVYQLIKYQSRDGWSHRDLLRLAHPKPTNTQLSDMLKWVVDGWEEVSEVPHSDEVLRRIWAFEAAKRAESAKEVVSLIREYDLPRECVPTRWLNNRDVWVELLQKMPLTAMIRNLATMTRVGLLGPGSSYNDVVAERITNQERLRRARVHPIAVLAALMTYSAGRSGYMQRENVQAHIRRHPRRGDIVAKTWAPVRQIVDALDAAFYLSFGNVPPTGKRLLFGLDVSGSMEWGEITGVPGLTPRIAAAAMALVTANVEKNYEIMAFSHQFAPLDISPRQRLDDVVKTMRGLWAGGTDCSLPMLYAMEHKMDVDCFCVLTDNETWYGDTHPIQALQQYRRQRNTPAKLIVVGMTATEISIADPNDGGCLDVVGFDAAAPQVISDFVAA